MFVILHLLVIILVLSFCQSNAQNTENLLLFDLQYQTLFRNGLVSNIINNEFGSCNTGTILAPTCIDLDSCLYTTRGYANHNPMGVYSNIPSSIINSSFYGIDLSFQLDFYILPNYSLNANLHIGYDEIFKIQAWTTFSNVCCWGNTNANCLQTVEMCGYIQKFYMFSLGRNLGSSSINAIPKLIENCNTLLPTTLDFITSAYAVEEYTIPSFGEDMTPSSVLIMPNIYIDSGHLVYNPWLGTKKVTLFSPDVWYYITYDFKFIAKIDTEFTLTNDVNYWTFTIGYYFSGSLHNTTWGWSNYLYGSNLFISDSNLCTRLPWYYYINSNLKYGPLNGPTLLNSDGTMGSKWWCPTAVAYVSGTGLYRYK